MAKNDDDLTNAAPVADESAQETSEESPTAPEQETPETPAEAEEAPEAAAEEPSPEPAEPKSRKERREERRKSFLESVRKGDDPLPQAQPEKYDPLDLSNPDSYSREDNGEKYVDPTKLVEDREKYAQTTAAQAREEAKAEAAQERFMGDLQLEGKIIKSDPKFQFMNEDSEEFDPDLTQEFNEEFLALVDHSVDPVTGKHRFGRPNMSYEQFVRTRFERMERYAEARASQSTKNIVAAKSKASPRPTGSGSKGLGKLKPGDISQMSPEEYEKNKDAINSQLNSNLGL